VLQYRQQLVVNGDPVIDQVVAGEPVKLSV